MTLIIDLHRHMWSVRQRYPAAFADAQRDREMSSADLDWTAATVAIVDDMKAVGITRTVLFVADFESRLGTGPFSIHDENRLIWMAHEQHPSTIVPFFGIDPRRNGAADLFEKAIDRWSVRGIKLHPAAGFFPHDPACMAIYEICSARGLPVIFHVGPGFHPVLYSRYAHPLEYDQVAADFPDLTMVMAHAGGEWWEDCSTIARSHPNMVLELSEWQVALRDRPEEAHRALAAMLGAVGRERIAWGSDFPGMSRLISLSESVRVIHDLPISGRRHGLTFSESDVEAILGSTSERILGKSD